MSVVLPRERAETLGRFKPYPAYKDSGVEWLGKIPAHWDVKRLRFVTESNPVPSEVRSLPGETEVSFVPMEAVGEQGGLSIETTKQLADVKAGYTYFRNGDIVIAKITPCFENGKGALAAGLTNGIAFGTTELHVLRMTERADRRFAFYLTLSDPFRRLGEADMYGAGGQKRISESFVRNFSPALPSLPEQRAIAAFLDRETARIDALVAKKERLIDLLQEQRTAIIEAAVASARASPEARLGYYVDLLPGYAFPSDRFSHDSDDVRLLRGVNISPESIRWDETVYWPPAESVRYATYQLREGDLVFGMDRPWISTGIRVAEVTRADVPSLLLQRVARLRARHGLSQRFLKLVLSSPQFRAYFEPILTGISVPHVSPEQILSFRLRLPTLADQEAVCESVKAQLLHIESMNDILRSSIDRLKELRTTIICAAVTGRIDVREVVA